MMLIKQRAIESLLGAITIALLAPCLVKAQTTTPWLNETERAKFEQLRVAGSEALFNLDYDEARKNFKAMADAFPNYPAGSQFLADTLWAETLYQSRRLQSSLYGDTRRSIPRATTKSIRRSSISFVH